MSKDSALIERGPVPCPPPSNQNTHEILHLYRCSTSFEHYPVKRHQWMAWLWNGNIDLTNCGVDSSLSYVNLIISLEWPLRTTIYNWCNDPEGTWRRAWDDFIRFFPKSMTVHYSWWYRILKVHTSITDPGSPLFNLFIFDGSLQPVAPEKILNQMNRNFLYPLRSMPFL